MAYEVYRSPGVAPPTNLDMNSPEWADYQQRIRADQAASRAVSARNAAKRDGGITKWMPRLAYSVIGAATAGAAAPPFSGAAAASSAAPAVVPAAKAGGAMTFGNLLKLGELGVGVGSQIYGQRSQNRALDRQSQIEQQNYGQQMDMAREQEAYRRSEAARVAAEEQRRWEAEEAFREREYNEREARRAPRRQASQQALLRLQDLLRLGGR